MDKQIDTQTEPQQELQMDNRSLQSIEHEIALLVRFATARSTHFGHMDRSGYVLLSKLLIGMPIAINVLADELKLNLSTASRQIAALEMKGFIRRFPDEKNGRISLVEITYLGRETLQKVKKARYGAYAEILGDYSQEELQGLDAALVRLNQAFMKWEK